jgi:hydroxysqualene dehydroxylase
MRGHVHIVGAGVAGLSAALAAIREGHAVTLYEAAPQAGGRCRTIHAPGGFSHDNGTHVLFTANHRALGFLQTIRARDRWLEPEAHGIPIFNADSKRLRHVGLSPWSWLDPERRPDGLQASDVLRLIRLVLPLLDRPVGSVAGSSVVARTLIEPLTLAVLNTPVDTASTKRLARALRRIVLPGAAKVLVAQQGLGADLIDPAVAVLRERGAALLFGRRLRELVQDGGTVTALIFADRHVPIPSGDRIVLALPPQEIARLLPGIPVPETFEPILNVHYQGTAPNRPRFIGLTGSLAQWVLIRRDHVSVTVSAARATLTENAEDLATKIWGEIAPALHAAGIAAPHDRPEARVVKEKRATIRQAAGPLPQPSIQPLRNLALAGDWIGTLPATIESAVLSGERAVRALGRPRSGAVALPETRPLVQAGGAS